MVFIKFNVIMDKSMESVLSSLSLISQKKLEQILMACGSDKDFVIDPVLIKPLEKICGVAWLRQNGVAKIFKLESQFGSTNNNNKVFFISMCLETYKLVLNQIQSLFTQSIIPKVNNSVCIIILPKVLGVHKTILETKGLHGLINLYSFCWEFIALDKGVLSLELPSVFKYSFINKDQTYLSSIGQSLWSLSQVIGYPDIILSVGKLSETVVDIYEINNNTFGRRHDNVENSFDALVIIDRNQDYISSLLTPSTYSGLINEVFNVNCGMLDLKDRVSCLGNLNLNLETLTEQTNSNIIALDSQLDPIYNEIKYKPFSEVLSILSAKSKAIKSEGKDLCLEKLKQFVSTKLQHVTITKEKLVKHVLSCEIIISELSHKFESLQRSETDMINNCNRKSNLVYVEENFVLDSHMLASLKLMCILSITQNLTCDEFNSLYTKYLHAFGHKYFYIFSNLVEAGLLIQPTVSKIPIAIPNIASISEKIPGWQNKFQIFSSKLKQISMDCKKTDQVCPSFVFNGAHIPLVAVICQILLNTNTLTELLNKLFFLSDAKIGGRLIENVDSGLVTLNECLSNINIDQTDFNLEFGSKNLKTVQNHFRKFASKSAYLPLKSKSVLVYIVGGITHAEIASCDLLKTVYGGRIVLASDSIISGNNLIKSAI